MWLPNHTHLYLGNYELISGERQLVVMLLRLCHSVTECTPTLPTLSQCSRPVCAAAQPPRGERSGYSVHCYLIQKDALVLERWLSR